MKAVPHKLVPIIFITLAGIGLLATALLSGLDNPNILVFFFGLSVLLGVTFYHKPEMGILALLAVPATLGWVLPSVSNGLCEILILAAIAGFCLRMLLSRKPLQITNVNILMILFSLIAALSGLITGFRFFTFEPVAGIGFQNLPINEWGITSREAILGCLQATTSYFSWGLFLLAASNIQWTESFKNKLKYFLAGVLILNEIGIVVQMSLAGAKGVGESLVFPFSYSGLMGSSHSLGLFSAFVLCFLPLWTQKKRSGMLEPVILIFAAACLLLSGHTPAVLFVVIVYIALFFRGFFTGDHIRLKYLVLFILFISAAFFALNVYVATTSAPSHASQYLHLPRLIDSFQQTGGPALEMVSSQPFAGFGSGSFFTEIGNRDALTAWPRADNEGILSSYLKIAAELGLVGIAVFFAALLGLFISPAKSSDRLNTHKRFYIKTALAGFACLLFLGDYLAALEISLIIWLFAGAILSRASPGEENETAGKRNWQFAAWLIPLVMLVFLFGSIQSYIKLHPNNRWEKIRWPLETGFYPEETAEEQFRWTAPIALKTCTPDRRFLLIQWKAEQYDEPPFKPEISFFLDDKLLGKRSLFNQNWHHSVFLIDNNTHLTRKLVIKSSPPFVPDEYLHNGDTRQLGIAVARIDFVDELPTESLGFWQWETSNGRGFQWSMAEAYRKVPINRGILSFSIKASHPDLRANPVTVRYELNGALEGSVILDNQSWRDVEIDPSLLPEESLPSWHESFLDAATGILKIEVDRTWIPAENTDSDDNRQLGVAVSRISTVGGQQ